MVLLLIFIFEFCFNWGLLNNLQYLLLIWWNWSSAIKYFVDQEIFPDTVDNQFLSGIIYGKV